MPVIHEFTVQNEVSQNVMGSKTTTTLQMTAPTTESISREVKYEYSIINKGNKDIHGDRIVSFVKRDKNDEYDDKDTFNGAATPTMTTSTTQTTKLRPTVPTTTETILQKNITKRRGKFYSGRQKTIS